MKIIFDENVPWPLRKFLPGDARGSRARHDLVPPHRIVFLIRPGGAITLPANLESGFAEEGGVIVGEGKFVAVRKRVGLFFQIVIVSDRLGNRDEAGGAERTEFPEEGEQLVAENILEDSAIRDEDGLRGGVSTQPLEEITRVEKEAIRIAMLFAALRDLAFVQIDPVELADPVESFGKPFENSTVARTNLNETSISLARERDRSGNVIGNDSVVAKEEILKPMGKSPRKTPPRAPRTSSE